MFSYFENSDNSIFFDSDDTLLLWGDDPFKPGPDTIKIKDPMDDGYVFLKPHMKHIEYLKKNSENGWFITVWSQGGAQWARTVVEALEIEDYVDLVISKPFKYVDDLPCEEWMGDRKYWIDE